MTLEPVPREVLLDLDRRDREHEIRKAEADRARLAAAEAVALASIGVVKFLIELMHNEEEDTQARLRAADILMSRQIPKVAAKHAGPGDEDAIDTVDVAALRDSILEQIKKGR